MFIPADHNWTNCLSEWRLFYVNRRLLAAPADEIFNSGQTICRQFVRVHLTAFTDLTCRPSAAGDLRVFTCRLSHRRPRCAAIESKSPRWDLSRNELQLNGRAIADGCGRLHLTDERRRIRWCAHFVHFRSSGGASGRALASWGGAIHHPTTVPDVQSQPDASSADWRNIFIGDASAVSGDAFNLKKKNYSN